MLKHQPPGIRVILALALVGLAGCQTPQNSAPLTQAPALGAPPAPADVPAQVGPASQHLVVDVDPFHAAAFERATDQGQADLQGSMRMAVEFPQVSFDPATHQTTVTVQVTNAGATLSDLNCQVQSEARLLTEAIDPSLVKTGGGTQTLHLVFDTPNADSFSFNLNFSGDSTGRHVMAVLGGLSATADSFSSNLQPSNAIDGDLSTQWANGGWRNAESWLQLDTGSVHTLGSVNLKMRPLSGSAHYRIEVSSDGSSFTPVTGNLTNTSWNVETKSLPSGTSGRYLRLHFYNDPSAPMDHFSVFEAQLSDTGSGGTAPSPTPTSSTAATPTPAPTATPVSGSGGLSATASSSYGTLTPGNAIDGNLSTQWCNDGYKQSEAWLALDTGAVRSLPAITVKMQPQSTAAYYRIEVSNDGATYSPVTGQLKNTTWNMETKNLPSGTSGRFVRLHFFNDPTNPEVRFAVFEAQVSGVVGTPAPTPAPTATPTPTPTPTATPTPVSGGNGALADTFEQNGLGSDPSDFIDPIDEGYSYSWMPRVKWQIVNYNGSHAYEHEGLSNTANLSFRRYRGGALGTSNGQLPNRYFASVDCTPVQSYTYSPTGDQGTQFYYLDPTHYVELQIKPNYFEIWVCNGGQPFQSSGWSRVAAKSTTNLGGQTHHLAATIDAYAHSIQANFDNGAWTASYTDSAGAILTTQTHYFSLRGVGNIVNYDNLVIQPQ